MNTEMMNKAKSGKGFIAALDQSGGSTPKALQLYGIEASEYSGDEQMYDLIHAMRSRIIKSSAFSGERVIGAILFEMTFVQQIKADIMVSVGVGARFVPPRSSGSSMML